LRAGEFDEAEIHAAHARDLEGELQNPIVSAGTHGLLAVLQRVAGDEEGAAREWREAERAIGRVPVDAKAIQEAVDADCDAARVARFRPGPEPDA
jgi:hypothetical protein